MMQGGYTGKYLDVDLTTGDTNILPLECEEALPYIGGKGTAALLLLRLLPAGADPLSPDNVVVINTGPLTATGTPGSSRFNLSTKSPLTGLVATANCGGTFGLHLKRAGYDGLILRGRAPRPVWLEIDAAGARIRDASHLWGKGALEAQGPASRDEGKLAIGPAGENGVRFACVMSGERALARCGAGAVLGSKNLKGATARGKGRTVVSDPSALKEVVKAWAGTLRTHPITGDLLHNQGTPVLLDRTDRSRTLPVRNFQRGGFAAAREIDGERLRDDFVVGSSGCFACPVRCGRVVENPHGEGRIRGPEYETLGLLGSNLEVSSLGHIITWNHICDEMGMDTISTGAVLGTAMELADEGLLECGLRFGETAGVPGVLEDIAHRRGLGDIMAEGALRLAESRGLPGIAPHSKGLELPAYHPRFSHGHALGYATANRGGCHLNGGYLTFFEGTGIAFMAPYAWRGKASLVALIQDLMEGVSAAGGCLFSVFAVLPAWLTKRYLDRTFPATMTRLLTALLPAMRALDLVPRRWLAFNLPATHFPFPQALAAVTGEYFNLGRLLEAGQRIWNLERLLNLREGLDPAADNLNARMVDGDGVAGGRDIPLDRMVPAYYRARGWDMGGRPKPSTLRRLGLDSLL